MNHSMKKIVSILLSILLLFSFLTPAFAADRAATEDADVSVFDKLRNGIMSFFNDLVNRVKALIQRVKALFQKNWSDERHDKWQRVKIKLDRNSHDKFRDAAVLRE